MKPGLKTLIIVISFHFFTFLIAVSLTVKYAVKPFPASLSKMVSERTCANILDRHGYILSITRQNRLNPQTIPMFDIPDLLASAFIYAEDKRFYKHHGVDWLARTSACIDNIKAGSIVRGASTITEQCVRIIHPRPRTFFTRWVETLEAYILEHRFSKDAILEFYLNQVAYSHQCRGIAQAADLYFNRSLDTLDLNEILTLAVIVRAPSVLNPYNQNTMSKNGLRQRIQWLAHRLEKQGLIKDVSGRVLLPNSLQPSSPAGAPHFVRYIKKRFSKEFHSNHKLLTTLDLNLQSRFYRLLKESLKNLETKHVKNSAILVLDHQTDDILAWVNGSDFFSSETGSRIDAVTTLRQPGSALKPFLYASALEKGYTSATIIPDIPLTHAVGHGIHSFRNYSSRYYGPVRLRCALGNSLNTPAIRVINDLGVSRFLDTLHNLEIQSLDRNTVHYGEGLALGNGEVTLFELVRAYSVLARSGVYREPRFLIPETRNMTEKRIFSKETCSIISHILSDPSARALEFGAGSLFDLPVQTAVKTGTSTDYRDAWAIGYNYKYTVGVWMGNLDYTPTDEITGSSGPALVLRSVFHELNKGQKTYPLFLSRTLTSKKICSISGMLASSNCPGVTMEWFRKEHAPKQTCTWHRKQQGKTITHYPHKYQDWLKRFPGYTKPAVLDELTPQSNEPFIHMAQPVQGLHLALDPRIPDELERFRFIIKSTHPVKRIDWFLDNILLSTTGPDTHQYPWKPIRGRHNAYAGVTLKDNDRFYQTSTISFLVK